MNLSLLNFFKYADITLILKKEDETDKANYHPISILPLISKSFQKILYAQKETFMGKKLSNLFCGIRKNNSKKHALSNLLQ